MKVILLLLVLSFTLAMNLSSIKQNDSLFKSLSEFAVPILTDLAENKGQNNQIKMTKTYSSDHFISIDLALEFNLNFGWKTERTNPQVQDRFDFLLTPYISGDISFKGNGSAWLFTGGTELHFSNFNISAPLPISRSNSGRVCLGSSFAIDSLNFKHHLLGALRECSLDINGDFFEEYAYSKFSCSEISGGRYTMYDLDLSRNIDVNLIDEF
mmetsp:Transcript_9240/g.10450  ORF Transcript_9240/g.10450 Transcript_9240/m.10450 type:complete len:212 (-) Transcript_9240:37-672(-)